ncbi:hypothetical protein AB0D99_08295 [Streptomyces sp. NPDC047971]
MEGGEGRRSEFGDEIADRGWAPLEGVHRRRTVGARATPPTARE